MMNEPCTDNQSDNPLLRVWIRIEALPTWIFIAWILTLLILRTGPGWAGTAELEHFARDFPHPGPTFRSNSVLGSIIGWATAIHTRMPWVLLHAGLTLGWFALVGWLLQRRLSTERAWRVSMVWLSFFAGPASMLRRLGSYDVFSATGAALIALSATPLLALAGGVIIGATNAEQGVLAVFCGALACWAIPTEDGSHTAFREVLSRFGAALAGLVASRTLVLIWFHYLDATVEGRNAVFNRLLSGSLFNAIGLGTTGLYAWLSVAWIIVIATLWQLRNQPVRWLAAGIGLVAIPAAVTVTTLDGSRVFAVVGSVALLYALMWFAEMASKPEGTSALSASAALMLFGLLIPSVVTVYTGGISVPWQFVIRL